MTERKMEIDIAKRDVGARAGGRASRGTLDDGGWVHERWKQYSGVSRYVEVFELA